MKYVRDTLGSITHDRFTDFLITADEHCSEQALNTLQFRKLCICPVKPFLSHTQFYHHWLWHILEDSTSDCIKFFFSTFKIFLFVVAPHRLLIVSNSSVVSRVTNHPTQPGTRKFPVLKPEMFWANGDELVVTLAFQTWY